MNPLRQESWELFRITVSARTEWLVLRVCGPDGDHGYGECSDAGSLETVIRELDRFDGACDSCGFAAITVRGAVEQARLDRAARRADVPCES